MDLSNLTLEQRLFANHMLNGGDAASAAEFMGFDLKTAEKWIDDPMIQAAIDHDKKAEARALGENRNTMIARYVNWATVDPGDYFHRNGPDGEPLEALAGWAYLKAPHELTAAQRKCIKKIKHGQHGPEIEFHDPVRATDKLADIFGLFDDKEADARPEDFAAELRAMAAEMERVSGGG